MKGEINMYIDNLYRPIIYKGRKGIVKGYYTSALGEICFIVHLDGDPENVELGVYYKRLAFINEM